MIDRTRAIRLALLAAWSLASASVAAAPKPGLEPGLVPSAEAGTDPPSSRSDVLRAEHDRLVAKISPIVDVSVFGASNAPTDADLEDETVNLYAVACGLDLETPLEGPSRYELRNVNVRDPQRLTEMVGRIRRAEQRLQDRLTSTEREIRHRWTAARARERLLMKASLRFWTNQREKLTKYLEKPGAEYLEKPVP